MRLARRGLLLAAALLPAVRAPGADEALWARLRAGRLVLLMRHARTTAGVGDPPGYRLDDCATQRNLDEAGRAQARAWGEALRRNEVAVERVLTSRWCRCIETAALLGFGEPEPFRPLNSFFDNRSGAAASRAGIRGFVGSWSGPGVAVLVTHQVNITAAYDVTPAMGGALVLAGNSDGGGLVGRLSAPASQVSMTLPTRQPPCSRSPSFN